MTTLDVLAAASLASVVAAVFGWPQGYHALGAYAAFWLLAALAGASAARLERSGFPSGGAAERLVRVVVIAFALVVVWTFGLGVVGGISIVGYVVMSAVTFLAVRLVPCQTRVRAPLITMDQPAIAPFAFIAIILVLAASTALSHLPIRYDSLNYHLYFPAAWLQAHHLTIVPTPFGDEAPAYAPSNAELLYLWLMTPFHGDLLARAAQVPFYALAAMVLYVLGRRAGASAAHAVWPSAFLIGGRRLLENAAGADVDIVFLGVFLSAVLLGFIAAERDRRNDWIVWGVAVGLCCGTKFVALVYAPLWLLICCVRGVRVRALWAIPGLLSLALPWYIRNWVVAGSPIYPSSLTFAGLTLARGAFTHAAMANSIFHVDDPRLLAFVAADAFGPTLFLVWIPAAVVGIASMLARGAWLTRLLAALPFVLVPLDWYGAPDNTDPRFLFPIVALALLPFAFAFGTRRRWNAIVHVLYGAALVWLVVGAAGNLEMSIPTMPSFMVDGLSMAGLLSRSSLLAAAGLAAAAALVIPWVLRGHPVRRGMIAAGASLIVCGAVTAAACPTGGCNVLALTPTNIRSDMFDGWDWIRMNARGETVAYAGNNIPYPLFGERLANRVVYVNLDRHLDWKLHDYDRARRRREGEFESAPDLLATSSGVLTPTVAGDVSTVDAVRPRFERMHGIREAWLANLESRQVTMLFVSVLSAYEIDHMWHDGAGFPVENAWAEADPASFHPVYANAQIRIYRVALPKAPA